jgi:predicted DsbA family dithiol-disulfide isomerase
MIIDAVYDFLCPWCLVGKRHLDLAVRQEQPEAIQIRWHQFMLYPQLDRAGHDFLAFFRERYGDDLRVPMWDAIRAVAKPVGIEFAFERMTRGPASLDGHRLVRWAEKQRPGSAAALIEDISTGFFELAQVINNDFLVAAADRHGFDGAVARAHLESDDDLEAPFAETEAWRRAGVRSMPHYILTFDDGHREVVTQTSVEVFADALRRDRAVALQASR